MYVCVRVRVCSCQLAQRGHGSGSSLSLKGAFLPNGFTDLVTRFSGKVGKVDHEPKDS